MRGNGKLKPTLWELQKTLLLFKTTMIRTKDFIEQMLSETIDYICLDGIKKLCIDTIHGKST